MYEELFNDNENLLPTPHPRIRAAVSADVDHDFIEHQIEEIKVIIHAKDLVAIQRKFFELVPGYQCAQIEDGPIDRACRQASFDLSTAGHATKRSKPVKADIKLSPV